MADLEKIGFDGSDFTIPAGGATAGVTTFNGRNGAVVPQSGDYSAALVGLGNVDNTSDADKPVSTATQAALDLKANAADMTTALAAKADTASLATVATSGAYADLTGTPTIPAALNDLTDVSASAPVAGQVLTCGDGGIWSPQAFQAAGFPGLDALDWKNPLNVGMTKGTLSTSGGSFEIAKFQNQAFFRVISVAVSGNFAPGSWTSIFTNVPAEWLPKKGNALSVMQTWGPSVGGSLVAICAGNNPSTIWMAPIVWNRGQNYLHGIVSWYVE